MSDWQNQATAKLESDLSITSKITDKIGQHEVLLPINHNHYNFRKKGKQINLGQTSPVGTMSKVKKFGNFLVFFFLRVSGCCYGYCDQLCDWWIKLSGHSMIGCFNCPIAGIRLQPTVRLQLCKLLVKCKAADAPIPFEEFVMVMINAINYLLTT